MAREDLTVATSVRAQVIDRDGSCCRVCGRYVSWPALHHIEYRSEGGLDVVENLIVIGWLPGHDCHLPVVHQNKRVWQPILKEVVASPVLVTGFQLRRRQLADILRENARSRRERWQLERLASADEPQARGLGHRTPPS